MYTKEFYLNQFDDFKKTIVEHITEICSNNEINEEKAAKRIEMYSPFAHTWARINRREYAVLFYQELMNVYDISWLNFSNSYNSCYNTPEDFLKAYSMLHEFDFSYESLGAYNFSNRKYHSLYTAIILILNDKSFKAEKNIFFEIKDLKTIRDETDAIGRLILEKINPRKTNVHED